MVSFWRNRLIQRHIVRFHCICRVWWATAVALSFSLCGYWAFGTWLHRGTDRLILRSSKSSITVDTIPFPAVTICPINKVGPKASEGTMINQLSYQLSLIEKILLLFYRSLRKNSITPIFIVHWWRPMVKIRATFRLKSNGKYEIVSSVQKFSFC